MNTVRRSTSFRVRCAASFTLALGTLTLLALIGCTTKWTKPGGSEQQFYADRYQCEQQAANSYPTAPQQVMTSPGVNMPQQQNTQTNCQMIGGQMQCLSQPVGVNTAIYNRPPQYATVDANAGARGNATGSCLMAKGYRRQ